MLREETITATTIGMASMGCLNTDGTKTCPKMGKSCNPRTAVACMGTAFRDFPETRTEVTIAAITMVSRTAKNFSEIRRSIASIEMAMQIHA